MSEMPKEKNFLQKHLPKLWFFRGMLASLPIIAAVENLTSIERLDFLRIFYFVAVEWEKVSSWIGGIIGLIPLVPTVSSTFVNFIVFASTISIPLAIVIYKLIPKNMGRLWMCAGTVFLTFYMFGTLFGDYPKSDFGSGTFLSFMGALRYTSVIFTSIGLAIFIGLMFQHLHTYRKGFLFVFGLILALQILYLLNLPIISESLKAIIY